MKVAVGLLVVLVVLVSPASAQFYRYVDSQGKVLYTDDILKVPVNQRPHVQQYTESQSPQVKAPAPEPAPTQPAAKARVTAQPPSTPEQLSHQRQALEKTFQDLQEEKKQLEAQRSSVHTFREHLQYNEKIAELEKKIQAYDAQRQAYNEAINQYSSWLNQQQKAVLAPAGTGP